MTEKKGTSPENSKLHQHYKTTVKKEISSAPWVLRVTEHSDRPVPVMIIKQRIAPWDRDDAEKLKAPRSVLRERGLFYGPGQLRCLPVIRTMVSRVQNRAGIPLELHRFLSGKRITFRGNLPLDDEAGMKLALLFKLQERIKEIDRVELMARRIDRFTSEESAYWYSRMTSFSPVANRWAMAGMKIMLSGHGGDRNLQEMLEEVRRSF